MFRKSLAIGALLAIGISSTGMAATYSITQKPEVISSSSEFALSKIYLGIEGGASILGKVHIEPDWANPGVHRWIPASNYDFNFGTMPVIGAKVGYAFTPIISIDLSYNYRGQSDVANGSFAQTGIPVGEVYKIKNLHSQTVMLDLNLTPQVNWGGISPFVFAGLGLAYNTIGEIDNWDNYPIQTFNTKLDGNSVYNFAWQAGAGINYAFTNKVSIDLAYRYVDLGKFESGNHFFESVSSLSSTVNAFKSNRVGTNEVFVVLKVNL